MFTISIHALAKRATVFVMKMPAIFLDFNPRPRKEGDNFISSSFYFIGTFQSTPSQRGRLKATISTLRTGIFQSTPSQRGRLLQICHLCNRKQFQSTPSQRGRPSISFSSFSIFSISIHALAKRATANLYNDYLYFEAKYHISDIFPL